MAPARQAAGRGSWQGGKREERQELQEPAGPGRLLNWGAWPAGLPRPPLPPAALPPSSALQTFLTNLGCCSPGRGNCHRPSTGPPETLNPFLPSRQSLQARGWGWAWVPRLCDPVRRIDGSPGWPQVSNLDQQTACRLVQLPIKDSLSSHFQSSPWVPSTGPGTGREIQKGGAQRAHILVCGGGVRLR